ncbi:MAG: hypothetical protein LKG19_01045 [Saprospiraceae bacterium]|jgi:antitoxin component HigA of HigAB toxin-antitoxin module|nr:hypothetical protein [Saprospiraceae bacterium]
MVDQAIITQRINEYWALYDKYYNLDLKDPENQGQYFFDLKKIITDEILYFEEKTFLINHISSVTITLGIIKKYGLNQSDLDSK